MKLFLSYRRQDALDVAQEFHLHFNARFGPRSVFWDCQTIPPDTEWQKVIRREIEAADVVLALIGPKWLEQLNQRLGGTAADHVREELEFAHKLGKPIVLARIKGGSLGPTDQLPESLRFLGKLHSPRLDLAEGRADELANLERRLHSHSHDAAHEAVVRLFARTGGWPWHSRVRDLLEALPGWWERWNFHDAAFLERLASVIRRDGADPNVVVLTGPYGSGRRYAVEATVRALQRTGIATHYLRLDLDGYEPRDEGVLRRYLEQQGRRRGLDLGADLENLLTVLRKRWPNAAGSLDVCATCGLLLDLSGSFRHIEWLLDQQLSACPPPVGRSLLIEVVWGLCRHQRIVVQSVDPASLACTVHGDLLLLASQVPELVLVLSAFDGQDARELAHGHATVELAVRPLEKTDLVALLKERCGSRPPPDWSAEWLWRASHGDRGKLALLLQGLVHRDVLDIASDEHWQFKTGPQADVVVRESFAQVVLQPLQRLYADAPDLPRVLQAAALCGEVVPLRILCRFCELDEDATDAVQDLVDEHLIATDDAEAPLLRDLEYNWPGLADVRTPAYQFVSPLIPEMLLAAVTPAAREQVASRLLDFLEKCLPATTRGVASLYVHLHRHLSHSERRRHWEQQLAWWIGLDEVDRLQQQITTALDDGWLDAESVWDAIGVTEDQWPPLRRLALVEAYGKQRDGVPISQWPSYLSRKGMILFELARYAEAEPLMRSALAIRERSLGPDHPAVATALNNLASLLQATNRLGEAEPLMRRALAIHECSFGADHPKVTTVLNNLALFLEDTNRLGEAEPLMWRALAIDERSFGPEHSKVATALNNLASLLEATNRLGEAEPLMRRVVSIFEGSLGENHPNVATALNNLASLLQATNRLEEAEPLMRRVLAIDERSFGPEHSKVATALNNLASLLEATNRLREAEPLMWRVVRIFEGSLGENHPNVATALNNLASLLQATNRLEEAEPLLRRALAIDERSFGAEHPKVATALNNLASLLQATNRVEEAEPLQRRALAIDERSFGAEHPKVATALNNLAQLLQATNRLEEAEPLLRRALAIDERSFGAEHPKVATALNNLALLLKDTNRLGEAEPLMRRNVEILHQFSLKYGHAHAHLGTALRNYRGLLQAMGLSAEEIAGRLESFDTPGADPQEDFSPGDQVP